MAAVMAILDFGFPTGTILDFGFPTGTILAILIYKSPPILPIKFQVNSPFGSEEAQKLFLSGDRGGDFLF